MLTQASSEALQVMATGKGYHPVVYHLGVSDGDCDMELDVTTISDADRTLTDAVISLE
ncbi:MAG: hypothetical protein KAU99_04050 [Thermoplasmata archaeon]|nr:hypothetical protein [Thermoplasmata archaeon]MCK4455501.1 hypothetical protein [Thermoplasmata archaeon]